jgi:drug/metabolite transporter (DMT)-like permease
LNWLALTLILSAALVHASWNYLLKKSGGGIGFVWLFGTLSTAFYCPLAIALVMYQTVTISLAGLMLIVASGVIHTAYYLLLDRGYRSGDLSVVYPIARATGPLITIVAAISFLGERPGALALCGAALVIGGAFSLSLRPGGADGAPKETSGVARSSVGRGIGFALLTGCTIAAYTLVDKQAVSVAAVPPLVFDWSMNLVRVALTTPLALRHRGEMLRAWRTHRRTAVAVALLNPLSYILVLTALVFTPVSYVAPAREISILCAALMGTRLLSEGQAGRRIACAGAMAVGVILLAVG